MQKIVPVSDINRRSNAAELVSYVSTHAPLSAEKKCPVVRAFLRQEHARGYTLVAEALSDEASAEVNLTDVNKDRADDTLAYLRDQFKCRGIETIDREDEWLAMKATSRTTS